MYILIGMSLLFITIGFIVTENNAQYLLAGYNTMSKEERIKVDIKSYISYLRKFHIFLGVSFFVIGTLLTYFADDTVAGIFTGIYPILAYVFFFISSYKYFKEVNSVKNKTGIFILLGALIFIIIIFQRGIKEDKLILHNNTLEIEGSYGEIITKKEIKSIELVSQKPKITLRTNGFAVGNIKKGYFKTDQGEKVKLILNGDNKPYILIIKLNRQKIYYSAKKESNEKLLQKIKPLLTQSDTIHPE